MKMLRPLLAAAAVLAVPLRAYAEGGLFATETEEYCHGHFCTSVHGFYIFDFLVFAALVIWLARKPIAAMLDKRYADVAKEIAAAQEAQNLANAKYDEYAKRIASLDTEMQAMLAQVRAGTEAEVTRILAESEAQVQRITAEEQARLEQESKRLRDQLRHEVADLALNLANQMLVQRLDARTQEALVDRSLREIEALPTASSAVN